MSSGEAELTQVATIDLASGSLILVACVAPLAIVAALFARSGFAEPLIEITLLATSGGPGLAQRVPMAFAAARITRHVLRSDGIAAKGGSWFSVLATWWLVQFLVSEGYAVAIVPGVVALAWLCMAMAALIAGPKGPVSALLASFRLGRGQRGTLLLLSCIVSLPVLPSSWDLPFRLNGLSAREILPVLLFSEHVEHAIIAQALLGALRPVLEVPAIVLGAVLYTRLASPAVPSAKSH